MSARSRRADTVTDAPASADDPWAQAAEARDPRAAVVGLLRAAFDAARDKAGQRLEAGLGGVEVARLYAAAADDMLAALWVFTTERLYPSPNPTDAERLSLIAVGGYGRGVLAPHSDLDLLFLRPWKTTPRTESVAEFILYVLWDLGLKVGSAVRSTAESLSLARSDMTIRTALLEARHLAGDEGLSKDMLTRFHKEAAKADPRPFIAAKLEERNARHQKTGAVRYRVEPNVKDGKGGLRDLNTLFWIARSLAPDSPLGERALGHLLTPRERRLFEEAFDFLWRVRHHLHLIAGRAIETLSFDLQLEVARRMGWRDRGEELAVERFMRRYFVVARDVGALTRAMSAKLEADRQKTAMGLSRLLPRRRRKLGVAGFIDDRGRLSVAAPDVFEADPTRLLELFRLADDQDMDLHPDALTAVNRSLGLVTPRLRRDPRAARAFLDILAHGQRPYRVLSLMNETGLLGRFLPEWGRIVGQTQFNMYHAFTVDEHTLQAIGIINDIHRGKLTGDHPVASELIHRISDREALNLAMLLHDVGKGGDRGQLEDGAIAARRACERLGVDPRRIELVAWLVRNHLLLSDYAQKRDLSDPATIAAFAERVGDPDRMRMLLVLTVADIRAVGPGVWNGWKGQLMRELHQKTEALFRGETVGAEAGPDHAVLIARARADGAAAEAREAEPGEAATEVVVAAPDRPGLFAALAAVMAAAGADVTGARVETRADGMALDVFQIQDGAREPYGRREPRRLTMLLQALERAGRGEGAPAIPSGARRRAAIDMAPVVMIDDSASDQATVVEVSGLDRPGLLAALAATLTDQTLSIRSAHVASFGERAADTFYVVDGKGRKITGDKRRAALVQALEGVFDDRTEADTAQRPRLKASMRDVSDLGASAAVPRRRKAR